MSSLDARRRFGPRARWRPLCETLTSGLGLGNMSLAWPAVVQLLVFICSGTHWNCCGCSSLLIMVINLICMFWLWCIG